MSFGTVVSRSQVTFEIFISCKLCRVTQVTRGDRVQVVGRSLIGRKVSQVSWRSVASVSRRSGRGRVSGTRVYADKLTNVMWGSRARKSVVVRSQVSLIIGHLYTCCLLVCQSLPDIDVNIKASLRAGDKSLTTAHESKKSIIFQLVNRFYVARGSV